MGRVDDGNDAAALAGDSIHDDVTVDQQAFLGKAGVKEFEDLSPDEARKRLKYVYKATYVHQLFINCIVYEYSQIVCHGVKRHQILYY